MKRFVGLLTIFLMCVILTHAQTVCTNQFPTSINSRSTLCDVGDLAITSLSSSITSSTTVISVSTTGNFSSTGIIVIDSEQMFYSSKTSNTFTTSQRGANGTTANSHAIGAQVKQPLTKRHIQTQSDAQIAKEIKLGTTPVGEQNSPVNGTLLAGRVVAGTSSYRTFAQLGIVSEAGLSTDDVPKWDGTQFVPSSMNDSSVRLSINNKVVMPGTKTIEWDSTNINPPSTSNIYTGARNIFYTAAAPDQVSNGLESGYFWMTGPGYKWYFAAGNNGVTTLTQNGLAINNANLNSAAALQVDSTTRGMLPPRMTTTQRNLITSPPEGLVIYNLTDHVPNFYNSGTWVPYGTVTGSGTVGAYPIFVGTSTLGNGYWKQGTNVLAMDGAGSSPEIELFTNGTLGQTNTTYGILSATVNAVTLSAGRTGSYSSQVTGINLNMIGSTSALNIQRDGTTKWTFEQVGSSPTLWSSDGLNALGKSTAPIGRIFVTYDGGIQFESLGVFQSSISASGLGILTISPGGSNPIKLEYSSGIYLTSGSGSPEGVVTASPSSIYSRTDDGHVWRKNTGTATNTGWVDMSSGGTTINSTNGIIPVRSNSTTFIDSPLSVSGGNVLNSGQFLASDLVDSTPAYSFTTRTDTGFGHYADEIRVFSSGSEVLRINSRGVITKSTGIFAFGNTGFGDPDTILGRASASVVSFTDAGTGGSALQLPPKTNTPASPASSNEINMYVRGNKFVIQYNDAGTVRYKYLDLTSTTVTWTATTTAP